MTNSELLDKLSAKFSAFQDEAMAGLKGNKSAFTRSRKKSSELDKLFKQWRSQTIKSSIPYPSALPGTG